MKTQHLASFILFATGVLALIHQYIFTLNHLIFQSKQLLHHETLTITLWALAAGITIGNLERNNGV